MKIVSRRRILQLCGVTSLAMATNACENNANSGSEFVQVESGEQPLPGGSGTRTILADGSSTVGPITQAIAEEFTNKYAGVRIPVGISGTGGGFKKFCVGETDITNASRFIRENEHAICLENRVDYIELPVAIDGIAVVVNPDNKSIGDFITTDELKTMWAPEAEGQITKWSQVRLGLPDDRLIMYGPGSDSGTYDYFTKKINGVEGASRGDYTPSEDDNVLVKGVSGDRNSIGFFGLSYYHANKDVVKALKIDAGTGTGPVFPSDENVLNGGYTPLSRVIFIYVSPAAAKRTEIEEFVSYYLSEAKNLVGAIGYVPLPDEMYDLALQRFADRKTGSIILADPNVSASPTSVLDAWKRGL